MNEAEVVQSGRTGGCLSRVNVAVSRKAIEGGKSKCLRLWQHSGCLPKSAKNPVSPPKSRVRIPPSALNPNNYQHGGRMGLKCIPSHFSPWTHICRLPLKNAMDRGNLLDCFASTYCYPPSFPPLRGGP